MNYSKYIQNNLERHYYNANHNAKSINSEIKKKKLNIAIKIINQLGSDLGNTIVEVKTVPKAPPEARDTIGTDTKHDKCL